MEKNKISNFLTPDISYLLGLITGRGEIQYNRDVKKIIIDFEYKNQKVTTGKLDFDQKLHIQTSLDKVVVRLQNMGINVSKDVSENSISLVLKWDKEDIAWLFIKFLINGTRFSYHDFQVPDPIFESTEINKKEFIRGIGDVTGYVRPSNYYGFSKPYRHRVYLEITQKNWYLPPQLCRLLQSVDVPVQNINYGHPNLRDPNNKKGNRFWAKEHQMKFFAEDYQKIGFYISHKEQALAEFAEINKSNFHTSIPLCNGTSSRSKTKPKHPDESDHELPKEIKSKHFDGYKEICNCLNCYMQN
ncbi:hypothetical protein [Allomuricauda sp. SCSIO 65647]|uniref:hypothetical protein n=1 Tax=Allomuricauda sp. SCSIO 65647 TaxID=2908843 RepID=UPI001F3B1116|nr:hypothetical protein [Muricauda sp. SCSIO 65647]UJH68918.1 hypothetical protein L0P89_06800 [Muricauda sp. SCSIO 65647]